MSTSKIQYWGRAWKVTITTTPDDNGDSQQIVAFSDSWTPEPLDMTFETYQSAQQAFWYCDIAIYNLNSPTTQLVLKQGMQVKLEAGYQSQPYGTIFEGTLFQPMWERENGTDFKLTLHCLVGLIEETNNFVALSISSGLTQREIVARMAANARYTLDTTNVQIDNPTVSSRGSVYFGRPSQYFEQIAIENNLNYWITSMSANIRALKQQTTDISTLQYSDTTGLVFTPQQTQDGVTCVVLMDARAICGGQFQLSPDTAIRQLPRQQGNYPTILDQNGIYIIGAIRHYGESRGTPWYSELIGLTSVGALLALQTP